MSKYIEIVIRISIPDELGDVIKVDNNVKEKETPRFSPSNIPTDLLGKLVWMQLQKVRKDKGYTQSILADAVDLKQVSISHVENGRTIPSPQSQTRIAMALGYELGDLLDEMMDSIDWCEHENAIEEEMKHRARRVPARYRRHSLRSRYSLRNERKINGQY